MAEPAATKRPAYSPGLRTAVVLTGTGADGAYHAGVLRALQEAGTRIDLLAGRGVGAVGALFGCVDGSVRLWGPSGLWRSGRVARLYPWRRSVRALGWALGAAAAVLAIPVLVLAAGLVVYAASTLLDVLGPGTAQRAATSYANAVGWAFAPGALPTWLPRIALLLVAAVVLTVAVVAIRANGQLVARRRHRGQFWWTLLGAPMSAREAIGVFRSGLWELLRGGTTLREPDPLDLARRYADLLTDSVGQPGFREMVLIAHDLDVRRDLVFALLKPEYRRPFFLRPPAVTSDRRSAEAFDLSGVSRDHTLDAVAAALSLPVVCEPVLLQFPPEGYWRGETHRLNDRPGALTRLLEEVAAAGVQQVIIVAAAPEAAGPNALSPRPVSPRSRLGESLAAQEAAALRDALYASRSWFDRVFVVRPLHNPVGPLDLEGVFDPASERRHTLAEWIDRGYEDAYRQFIDPVVGESGETVAAERATAVRSGS